MASCEKSCCVGVFTGSDCFHLECYLNKAKQNLIDLTQLTTDEQRFIKLRVGSDCLTSICSHHLRVYLDYFHSVLKKTTVVTLLKDTKNLLLARELLISSLVMPFFQLQRSA